MTVDNLTLEEVQQRLAELVKQHDLAVQELEERKEQALRELTQQIQDLVAAQGYSMEEVLPLLTPKKRRSATNQQQKSATIPKARAAAAKQGANQDKFSKTKDKAKNDLPRRLKKKMIALGLDPKSVADRIRFLSDG